MRVLLSFLLSIGTFFGKSTGAHCPYFWSEFHGSCYALSETIEDWTKANFICEENGGHLVYIETADENAFVTNFLNRTTGHQRYVWIGANDMLSEKNFTWGTTGKPLTFTDWQKNQPDNGGANKNEDCVDIRPTRDYSWNDENCDRKQNFLCERSPSDEIIG